jgi:hypothetical protein
MRRTGASLDDNRLELDRVHLQHAVDIFQPALFGGVRVVQTSFDACDSLPAMAQHFLQDRLQKFGHGLASVDMGDPVDDNLHCSVDVL